MEFRKSVDASAHFNLLSRRSPKKSAMASIVPLITQSTAQNPRATIGVLTINVISKSIASSVNVVSTKHYLGKMFTAVHAYARPLFRIMPIPPRSLI